jgi:hypothetical protein
MVEPVLLLLLLLLRYTWSGVGCFRGIFGVDLLPEVWRSGTLRGGWALLGVQCMVASLTLNLNSPNIASLLACRESHPLRNAGV